MCCMVAEHGYCGTNSCAEWNSNSKSCRVDWTHTSDTQAANVAVTNQMTIMEHLNVPAGFAGLYARVEALESAGRIASNWEDLLREEVKKAVAEKGSNSKDGFMKGILESKAIWGIKNVDEAKNYRSWNKKF